MTHHTASSLAAAVRAEFEALQEFYRTLQHEQDALIKGDIDLLLQLAPRKSALIEQLSAFSADRIRTLAAAGYENNPSGIDGWMKAVGTDAGTQDLWTKLLELARKAEQINRNNGMLIETNLRHNQQALAVLRTAANPDRNLYGPNGQISSTGSGRPRGKV